MTDVSTRLSGIRQCGRAVRRNGTGAVAVIHASGRSGDRVESCFLTMVSGRSDLGESAAVDSEVRETDYASNRGAC